MEQNENKYTGLLDQIKSISSLYIENVKLTSAEKLTMLFASIALFSVVMVLLVLALVFLALGFANLLEDFIAPFWSFFIIAALYIIAAVLIVVFKTDLIVNPIARFISRLIINPPSK